MEKKSMVVTNSKVRNYIHDDIAFSILSNLPIKSLKRFKCVRKSWSVLFENDDFMKIFCNNLFSNSHCCSYYDGASLILRVYKRCDYDLYSLSGKRLKNKVKLDCSNSFANDVFFHVVGIGSINGTLCLYNYNFYRKIVLWNPTTQEIKFIPPSPIDHIQDVAKNFVSLSVLSVVHGFGYDDLLNDYKVIRNVHIVAVSSDYRDKSLAMLKDKSLDPFWEIYSLRSNLWKKLDVEMPSYSSPEIEGTQVYKDGVCHWLGNQLSPCGICLVSFYLSNEVFFITPIPSDDDNSVYSNTWCMFLVALNEFIALISYDENDTFHISSVGEFGTQESWTKLLIVGPISCIQRPIGVGTKGEIFFVRNDGELVLLDLSTQMIEELGYKEIDNASRIIIHKENNLPIGGISN